MRTPKKRPSRSPGVWIPYRFADGAISARFRSPPPMSQIRHAIGFMSGTSLDGLDAAIVRTEGRGRDLRASVLTHRETMTPEHDPTTGTLRELARGGRLTATEITEAVMTMGRRHAELIAPTCHDAGLDPHRDLDLVAIHGQTVTHRPPRSWQLVDPWPVAAVVTCPVVCDLRAADLAAGGAGAPITPLADAALHQDLRSPDRTLLVLNLGGFANVTLLPGIDGEPVGFDCCACNHLLDSASEAALDAPFDRDGEASSAGRVDETIVSEISERLDRLAGEGRSGGDGDEHRESAITLAREARASGRPADALATLVAAIAATVARSVGNRIRIAELPPLGARFAAGGGTRNQGLMTALDTAFCSIPDAEATELRTTGAVGVPTQAREAAAIAILGLLALDGTPITTVASTGRHGTPLPSGLWIRGPGLERDASHSEVDRSERRN